MGAWLRMPALTGGLGYYTAHCWCVPVLLSSQPRLAVQPHVLSCLTVKLANCQAGSLAVAIAVDAPITPLGTEIDCCRWHNTWHNS
jgi:hypothetical protein